MKSLESASQAFRSAIRTGRIGTPVAARIVAHLTADHGQIERLAARTLESAAGWFGIRSGQLAARGSVKTGQLTALVRFAEGQTALVSAGSSGIGAPVLEMTLFGNRGVLSWEGNDHTSLLSEKDSEGELSETARAFLNSIRASLQSGEPISIDPRQADDTSPTAETKPWQNESDPSPLSPAKVSTSPGHKPPYGLLLVAGDYTHQTNYVAALTADKRCHVVGLTDDADVTDRRRKLNERLAIRLGVPVLPDLDQALRRKDVHIVSICSEPSRRGQIAVKAAEAGKHVYLDKPLAGSLRDADAIVRAVDKTGVISHMFSQVHTPWAVRTREIIESGELGNPTALHFDLCFAKGHAGSSKLGQPRPETAVPKRFELKDSKRELSNVGVYPLVLLSWLLRRKVHAVYASTGNYFFAEHQRDGLEDFGQALLELEGGVMATISVGRVGWSSHPSFGINRTVLIGSKGVATVDPHRPRVEIWSDAEPWSAPARNPEDPMGMWTQPPGNPFIPRPKEAWVRPPTVGPSSDASHFLDCIESGKESDIPVAVSAHVTEVLMAAYRSSATGKVVKLPLPRD